MFEDLYFSLSKSQNDSRRKLMIRSQMHLFRFHNPYFWFVDACTTGNCEIESFIEIIDWVERDIQRHNAFWQWWNVTDVGLSDIDFIGSNWKFSQIFKRFNSFEHFHDPAFI